MRPHPRIPKTMKWGGAAATVLLVAAAVAGRWVGLGYVSKDGWAAVLGRGAVILTLESERFSMSPGFHVYDMTPPPLPRRRPQPSVMIWRARVVRYAGFHQISCPLWMATIPLAIAAGIAWRLDAIALRRERIRLNRCPRCNYDRAGLVTGAVCPECGSAAA